MRICLRASSKSCRSGCWPRAGCRHLLLALLAMSRRQADVATPRRRGHASTQTSDSALEELVNLKLAVAAQGAELEELRSELPKLQAQSERTAVAEASQRVVEAASSAVPDFGSCVPPQGPPGACAARQSHGERPRPPGGRLAAASVALG